MLLCHLLDATLLQKLDPIPRLVVLIEDTCQDGDLGRSISDIELGKLGLRHHFAQVNIRQ